MARFHPFFLSAPWLKDEIKKKKKEIAEILRKTTDILKISQSRGEVLKILKGFPSAGEASGDWWQSRWFSSLSIGLQVDFETSVMLPQIICHETVIKIHIVNATKAN